METTEKKIKLSDIKETIPLAKTIHERFEIVVKYLLENYTDEKKCLSNMDCIAEHLSELESLKHIIDSYIHDLNVIKPLVIKRLEDFTTKLKRLEPSAITKQEDKGKE